MSKPASNRTVLVIDDEPAVRSVVRRTLERAGYRVIEAVDGVDGLAKHAESRGHLALIFLDLTMPRKSGQEVFREIRAKGDRTPVLISSAYSMEEVLTDTGVESLAVGALAKPFGPMALLAAVEGLVGNSDGETPDRE